MKKIGARYYEFDDSGKITKKIMLGELGVYEDVDKQIIDIKLWDKKGRHCHLDIPLNEVFETLAKHTRWRDRFIKKEQKK